MSIAIVSGSAGLIGSEASRAFAERGLSVVGIDNDMRQHFFGPDGSTAGNLARLRTDLDASYCHESLDVRDAEGIDGLFKRYAGQISAVIHAAAQPSHDWAARDPQTDFGVNAVGTLNLLEASRRHCAEATFVFCSTNKVYGDTPNRLPLQETETRYELDPDHTYFDGIREDMPIDHSLHSVFGASKVAADVMVQEYGRYFGMNTVCFRGGTLTGPQHSAAELHGFLAYLMRCTMSGQHYNVYGYKGKQVRDAIHSKDLIAAFLAFVDQPRSAAVYNIGGGRRSNCSVLEAIELCQEFSGKKLDWSYVDQNRIGDHLWWIGDNGAFERDYPSWTMEHSVPSILAEMYDVNRSTWSAS